MIYISVPPQVSQNGFFAKIIYIYIYLYKIYIYIYMYVCITLYIFSQDVTKAMT